jgi:hypothetical protein
MITLFLTICIASHSPENCSKSQVEFPHVFPSLPECREFLTERLDADKDGFVKAGAFGLYFRCTAGV